MPNVTAIILAAGSSSRMGELNKLNLELINKPVFCYALSAALGSKAKDIIIITGHEHDSIKAFIDQAFSTQKNITLVYNPDYKTGMASSIRCGIAATQATCDGAMILLADMPLINHQHINTLIEAFAPTSPTNIVAPYCNNKRGNPVLWAKCYFKKLLSISGDRGAKEMLQANQAHIKAVALDDEAIFMDIDTPIDLEKIQRALTDDH
jgi:molybdenum cofactor cytidylyltransferase